MLKLFPEGVPLYRQIRDPLHARKKYAFSKHTERSCRELDEADGQLPIGSHKVSLALFEDPIGTEISASFEQSACLAEIFGQQTL